MENVSPGGARDVLGGRVAWRERGAGELVILLHGMGGSRISWEPQFAGLGTSWRVAAWDLPGYGDSAPIAESPPTFRAWTDAAVGWMTTLGAHRVHVVGISMGGMVAQYLAAWHPTRVQTLTLLSTSPRFGLDGTLPDEWKATRLAQLDDGATPADFAESLVRRIGGPGMSDAVVEEQRAAMARISSVALRSSIECIVTHDSRRLLPQIVAPTLVLAGEFDSETPPEYSHYLAEHIPKARLVVVPHAGHLLNAEAPEMVNRLIAAHLTAHSLGGEAQ